MKEEKIIMTIKIIMIAIVLMMSVACTVGYFYMHISLITKVVKQECLKEMINDQF